MYNKIILAGNLTRDIEIRYLPSGAAVGNTGMAVNRRYKTQSGEQKDETMFIDITFFGRTAEIANQYLRKGSKVLVDGRLRLEQWTAQDGSKRSKHTVTVETLQMLGSRDDATHSSGYGAPTAQSGASSAPTESYSQPAAPAAKQTTPQPENNIPEIDINDDDEIPF